MIAPENWRGHCVACDREIRFNAVEGWKCTAKPGNHRLANKIYYHMGGSHLRHEYDRRTWSPTLFYARGSKPDQNGKWIAEPPLEIHFGQMGKLDVDDAEVQFNLETNSRGVGWGELGQKAWEDVYMTRETKQALADARLADTNRKVSEANALLEQTQRRLNKEPATKEKDKELVGR